MRLVLLCASLPQRTYLQEGNSLGSIGRDRIRSQDRLVDVGRVDVEDSFRNELGGS